jgi:hypothetical protein
MEVFPFKKDFLFLYAKKRKKNLLDFFTELFWEISQEKLLYSLPST